LSRDWSCAIPARVPPGDGIAEAPIQATTRFVRPINYLGLPVLVIPAGQSRSGLPIGLQLIGRPFGDETTIALARSFQITTDHHRSAW
jgi:aspartyl-tRNA(Asn)/glutamyl-tRNA(Gln) amidotransferase subunit A